MANRPVQRMDDYPVGDFSFIKDPMFREIYTHDFKVIDSIPGAWKFFKEIPNGFPFLFNPEIANVFNNSWKEHTTKTFNKSMNIMKSIAKIGWEDFVFLMRD